MGDNNDDKKSVDALSPSLINMNLELALKYLSSYSFSDIYRTNMFHLTSTGCALVLQKDLEYWGIDELMMEPCCALKYYPEIETCVNEKQVI